MFYRSKLSQSKIALQLENMFSLKVCGFTARKPKFFGDQVFQDDFFYYFQLLSRATFFEDRFFKSEYLDNSSNL